MNKFLLFKRKQIGKDLFNKQKKGNALKDSLHYLLSAVYIWIGFVVLVFCNVSIDVKRNGIFDRLWAIGNFR